MGRCPELESVVNLFRTTQCFLMERFFDRWNLERKCQVSNELEKVAASNNLEQPKDLSAEAWREYEFNGRTTPYRITSPLQLIMRPGGSTHRVIDAEGVVHCVPAPGQQGCVLRWKPKDPANPVQF